jgi:hypothetical protein
MCALVCPAQGPRISGNVKTDIPVLLKPGKYTVDIMDSVVQTPRQRELNAKFRVAIQEHYSWFVDYANSIPGGQPLPYHINMGLTIGEYDEFLAAAENPQVIASATETLTITKKDTLLHFDGTGRLSVLDSVKFYLTNNSATVLGFLVSYSDTIKVKSEKNPLKSKWSGYSYLLEFPKDIKPGEYKNLANLKYTRFKIVIGQLEKTGKTYLEYTGLKVSNGEKTIDFKLPLVFR